MNFLELINILYVITAFSGMVFLAHKKSVGFVVFLITECCMAYIGYCSSQYGVCTMAGIYFITNIWAYRKWER